MPMMKAKGPSIPQGQAVGEKGPRRSRRRQPGRLWDFGSWGKKTAQEGRWLVKKKIKTERQEAAHQDASGGLSNSAPKWCMASEAARH